MPFVIASMILAVVLLLASLFLCAFAWVRISHYLMTRRAVDRMRAAGRYLSRQDFENHAAASRGSVIFEYPTIGWRVMRIWWTPDAIVEKTAHVSDESSDARGMYPSPRETLLNDAYLDFDGGSAQLVPLYLFGPAPRKYFANFQARFPKVPTAFVRSALVLQERSPASRGRSPHVED